MRTVEFSFDYEVVFNEATQTFDIIFSDGTYFDFSEFETVIRSIDESWAPETRKAIAGSCITISERVAKITREFEEIATNRSLDNEVTRKHHSLARDILTYQAFKNVGICDLTLRDEDGNSLIPADVPGTISNQIKAVSENQQVTEPLLACWKRLQSFNTSLKLFGLESRDFNILIRFVTKPHKIGSDFSRALLWTLYKDCLIRWAKSSSYLPVDVRHIFDQIRSYENARINKQLGQPIGTPTWTGRGIENGAVKD